MTELNIFVACSKEVPLGAFVVARVKHTLSKGEAYGPDDIKEIYHAKGSQADNLFGWGIARKVADEEGKCLIIFNPDEAVTFPGEEDCD